MYINSNGIITKHKLLYWCNTCGHLIDKPCQHETDPDEPHYYGNVIYRRDIYTKNITYWCYECNKQVSQNCGHESFGDIYQSRDMSPGKAYYCQTCQRQVSENCGHSCYGFSFSLRDLSQEKMYYCDECGYVSENCGHEYYGHVSLERDMSPGKIYYCEGCSITQCPTTQCLTTQCLTTQCLTSSVECHGEGITTSAECQTDHSLQLGEPEQQEPASSEHHQQEPSSSEHFLQEPSSSEHSSQEPSYQPILREQFSKLHQEPPPSLTVSSSSSTVSSSSSVSSTSSSSVSSQPQRPYEIPSGRQISYDDYINGICTHGTYGSQFDLRDMTPGKTYHCAWCKKRVSENCGHQYYGNHRYLCTREEGDGYCKYCQINEPFPTYGLIYYYCHICQKWQNKNCGHGCFGSSNYELNIDNERKFMIQEMRRMKDKCRDVVRIQGQCLTSSVQCVGGRLLSQDLSVSLIQ